MDEFYTATYWDYLQTAELLAEGETDSFVAQTLHQTRWDNPQTSLDCNNAAVIALIEAEKSEDPTTRELYLEMAIAALEQGIDHPLCRAHWVLVKSLLGERETALNMGFSSFLSLLQPVHTAQSESAPGLIYLPQIWQKRIWQKQIWQKREGGDRQLREMLQEPRGDRQALLLLGEILHQSQLVFYNSAGLRFLQLAAGLFPQSAFVLQALGISSLVNHQWEGLLYLHQANQQQPNCPGILQSLYLAYKDLQQPELSKFWLTAAQAIARQNPDSPIWEWTKLDADSPFTYAAFAAEGLLAIEPSFQSIVTSVLLAQGDWFEQEMEFWRDRIQPGMTVVDVGANVGVYTLSAAQRVGRTGRVLAVEPFSNCVRCLQETCRVNNLDWVTVCRGAASDRNGTVRLALHNASELNEIITTQEELAPGSYEEAPCFSLDFLIEQENLQQVDILKIDAEGHELQVLQGSDRLLQKFAPVIMYENVAGSQGSNLPVANYLVSRGYQLFRYQPFLKQLVPVNSESDLQNSLNIIALPKS